jgi:hypothetical protein
MLTINGRRSGGRMVHLRFRGVQNAEATGTPEPGGPLRLVNVGSPGRFGILRLFFPILRFPSGGYSRVTIGAGSARLDIVCQDAEWWQDDAPADGREENAP